MLKDRLRAYREGCGYSQQKVADALNIHRSTYSYYESGKTEPSLDNICILAKIYGVTLDDLLEMDTVPSADIELRDPGYDTKFSYLKEESINRVCDLTKDEKTLIIRFRMMTTKQRKELLEAMTAQTGEKEEV